MLAKNMGLSLKEINEMPLYKVMLYTHAMNVMDGIDTRWEHSDIDAPKATMDDINKFIEEI